MKKIIPILLLALVTGGCARFHSEQVEMAQDGTKRTTHIYVLTLFDAQSNLTKLRATTTDKSQRPPMPRCSSQRPDAGPCRW